MKKTSLIVSATIITAAVGTTVGLVYYARIKRDERKYKLQKEASETKYPVSPRFSIAGCMHQHQHKSNPPRVNVIKANISVVTCMDASVVKITRVKNGCMFESKRQLFLRLERMMDFGATVHIQTRPKLDQSGFMSPAGFHRKWLVVPPSESDCRAADVSNTPGTIKFMEIGSDARFHIDANILDPSFAALSLKEKAKIELWHPMDSIDYFDVKLANEANIDLGGIDLNSIHLDAKDKSTLQNFIVHSSITGVMSDTAILACQAHKKTIQDVQRTGNPVCKIALVN